MSAAAPCCDYCGLPVPGDRELSERRLFCCFGCRFAADVARQTGDGASASGPALRLGLAVFFCMNVMATALPLWAPDAFGLEGDVGRQAALLTDLLRYLGLLFTIPVLVLLAPPLVEDAASEIGRRRPGASTLLSLGVAGAFAYSLVALWWGERHVYFETTCMLLASAAAGRFFEATGRQRAGESLRTLSALAPRSVRVVDAVDSTAAAREIPIGELSTGAIVHVRPGERIPADGRILRGCAVVDERIVTGESRGAEKSAGDCVWGGSLAVDGDLFIETDGPAGGGALGRLAAAVEAALATRGPWQKTADRAAAWFLPLVAVSAAVAFAIPAASGDLRDGGLRALAVVVVACPCALGLATPLAVWAAISAAARRGVLFRGGDALAKLASVNELFFDKTGTLTVEEPLLSSVWVRPGESEERAAAAAQHLAQRSSHPLCRSLEQALPAGPHDAADLAGFHVRTAAGRGVVAESPDGHRMLLGGSRLLQEFGLNDAESDSRAAVALAIDDRVVARYSFSERLRFEAAEAAAELRLRGVQPTLLSGDSESRVQAVAEELGLAAKGNLSPEQKLSVVRSRQSAGRVVAMVGDGLNDAPALAAADVGVALGCGADLSRDAAGVCLLSSDLLRLIDAIDTARRTERVVRGNVIWAFAYNVVGLVLAVSGWLSPLFAAPLMAISSVVVIQRSLQLAGPPEPGASHAGFAESPSDEIEVPRTPSAEPVAVR